MYLLEFIVISYVLWLQCTPQRPTDISNDIRNLPPDLKLFGQNFVGLQQQISHM